MRPRRDSSTVSKAVELQSGFRQKLCSAGKAYVPHSVQRDPSSAGPAPSPSPVVNHPSIAGTCVVPGHQASRSMMVALACPPPSHIVCRP